MENQCTSNVSLFWLCMNVNWVFETVDCSSIHHFSYSDRYFQVWRNQLSVFSESYICCSGQETFSSWLVRGQVKKSDANVFKVKKTTLFISEKVAADIKVERERKHLVIDLIQV